VAAILSGRGIRRKVGFKAGPIPDEIAALRLFHLAGREQILTMPVRARWYVRPLDRGSAMSGYIIFGTVRANDPV
jgi:hypothetical protein